MNLLSELVFIVYVILFIIFMGASSGSAGGIRMHTLNSSVEFPQWFIALFSILLSLLLSLFYFWFRYFQHVAYQITWKIYTLFGIIEVISIVIGIILFASLGFKVHLIWTSFIMLPVVFGTYLLFLGIWISNDFFFYEKDENEKRKKNTEEDN